MALCIKCKLEYDERLEDCATCKHTEAMFRAWNDVTRMGITRTADGDYERADFDEDIIEKHPILTALKYEPCLNIYQLERHIRKRLENLLINRQRYYKKKKGMPSYLSYSSTPIWKKDTTGKRKAPLVSATCFDIGEKMKGKDGIMYVVKRKKDGSQFWTRYRPTLFSFTDARARFKWSGGWV